MNTETSAHGHCLVLGNPDFTSLVLDTPIKTFSPQKGETASSPTSVDAFAQSSSNPSFLPPCFPKLDFTNSNTLYRGTLRPRRDDNKVGSLATATENRPSQETQKANTKPRVHFSDTAQAFREFTVSQEETQTLETLEKQHISFLKEEANALDAEISFMKCEAKNALTTGNWPLLEKTRDALGKLYDDHKVFNESLDAQGLTEAVYPKKASS